MAADTTLLGLGAAARESPKSGWQRVEFGAGRSIPVPVLGRVYPLHLLPPQLGQGFVPALDIPGWVWHMPFSKLNPFRIFPTTISVQDFNQIGTDT